MDLRWTLKRCYVLSWFPPKTHKVVLTSNFECQKRQMDACFDFNLAKFERGVGYPKTDNIVFRVAKQMWILLKGIVFGQTVLTMAEPP